MCILWRESLHQLEIVGLHRNADLPINCQSKLLSMYPPGESESLERVKRPDDVIPVPRQCEVQHLHHYQCMVYLCHFPDTCLILEMTILVQIFSSTYMYLSKCTSDVTIMCANCISFASSTPESAFPGSSVQIAVVVKKPMLNPNKY